MPGSVLWALLQGPSAPHSVRSPSDTARWLRLHKHFLGITQLPSGLHRVCFVSIPQMSTLGR